jgi:ABC-type transport system substrate-binding protein
MPRLRRAMLVAATAFALLACDATPAPTAPPGGVIPTPDASAASPTATEAPFSATAWPEDGSACGIEGYRGEMGRIEATDARTVVFTLCAPDGAFLAKLAHPAMGILDTAALARLAADPATARSLAGTGPYRIDAWLPGENVRLVLSDPSTAGPGHVPTVVLRWAADPAQRAIGLQSAIVDGIDAPAAADLDRIATMPELTVTPRDGLATAYLGFGTGSGLGKVAVRRALAASLDRDGLTSDALPAGSATATHVTPCDIEGGCGGRDWYGFNAPAATAALSAAGFDLSSTIPLHLPDQPVPGLPDPAGLATAIAAQLQANLALNVTIVSDPVKDYQDALATGKLAGLYLGGVASTIADPAAYLGPLFGKGVKTSAATRTPDATKAIADAGRTADPGARAGAFARANDAIRDAASIVPLGHPGSVAAFRTDVTGVVTSPLGLDPLGTFTPGDRSQIVFMQATEPDGAYCGDQASGDAYRLCGLVHEGLYGFEPGTMTVEPRLATRCEPNADATVWSCRLRGGVKDTDGARLDAGDVLASFAAQWDRSLPLRTGSATPFTAWTALFGDTIGGD